MSDTPPFHMTLWHLYIIECSDQSLYTGITCDLDRRLGQHNAGRASRYTRGRRPVRLVFSKDFPDRSSATRAEYRVKKWPRDIKLAVIEGKRPFDPESADRREEALPGEGQSQ